MSQTLSQSTVASRHGRCQRSGRLSLGSGFFVGRWPDCDKSPRHVRGILRRLLRKISRSNKRSSTLKATLHIDEKRDLIILKVTGFWHDNIISLGLIVTDRAGWRNGLCCGQSTRISKGRSRMASSVAYAQLVTGKLISKLLHRFLPVAVEVPC